MPVFVFGSNQAGRHGAGAALHALQHHGAKYGVGSGLQSQSYALPTKDHQIRTLHLPKIQDHISAFLDFASRNSQMTFFVTRIGCGLAGYQDKEIAPLFKGVPSNCLMPPEWRPFLGNARYHERPCCGDEKP